MPVAEETGLTIPIRRWMMLKTVCLQSVTWRKKGLPTLCIAVNLTARQFGDDAMLADLTAILSATKMDPHLLEVELTEGLLMQNVENTLKILAGLKALGIRIAIDDCGTWYSSLATLQRFPLDTIKIDRSSIQDLTDASAHAGLAEAVIAIGKSLSLTIVAQGVETGEQAEFLRTHAGDELQGYYFKKPVPADEFEQLMRGQAAESLSG